MSDYSRDPDSEDVSEFGLGTGMIDSRSREDRNLSPLQQMWEIKSLPKTYAGSELGLPGGERPDVETTPVPRLLPGEEATDRE